METLSDEALLAGMAAGDEAAAAAFVRRFQHRVFGLAVSVLRDRSQAEDVAQEAFVRAWRHAAVYDPRRGEVAAWLLTITRNLAIDAVRSRGARPVVDDAELGLLAWPGAGPERRATVDDEVSRLAERLDRLPAAQRRAVLLAAYGGLTAREIGELDGLPLGTVKTRIRGALRTLRGSGASGPRGSKAESHDEL